MPSLDTFGKLAIPTIIFYLPIAALSVILVIRHGFRRDAGWIFLAIFSLVRILGGALLIAAQLVRPVSTGLYIGAYVLEAAGLSPLLLATLGFLRTIGTNSFSENKPVNQGFRLLGILATVALILSIVGGVDSTDSSPSEVKQGLQFRHIGVILFTVLYALLVLVHGWCWARSRTLMKHRKNLLIAISCALPFLLIRVIYADLSAYSGALVPSTSTSTTSTTSTNSLAKFNMHSGTWWIYLIMSLIMEYIVVCIYTVAGTRIPLKDDLAQDGESGYAVKPQHGASPYAQPQSVYARQQAV